MHRSEGVRRPGWVRVLLLAIAAAVLASLVVVSPAAAEPGQDKQKISEDIAAKTCAGSINTESFGIPLPKQLNPNALCRSVIATAINPDNQQGIEAACGSSISKALPASPIRDRVKDTVQKPCVEALTKFLQPARDEFFKQTSAANERANSAMESVKCATEEGWGCISKQIQAWLQDSVRDLWSGMVALLTSPTGALELIDVTSDNPTAATRQFVSVYGTVGEVAIVLVFILFLSSLLVSLFRGSVKPAAKGIVGVMTFGLFWFSGLAIAVMLIKASDGIAQAFAGAPGPDGRTPLDKASEGFIAWIDYVVSVDRSTGASKVVTPTYQPGSVVALLIAVVLVIAIITVFLTLVFRNVSIVLIAAAFPILLGMSSGPAAMKAALPKAAAAFITVVISKPLIVLALRIGAGWVSVPEPGQPGVGAGAALTGAAVIVLAAFTPGVIYKLFHIGISSAGQRISSGPGLMEQMGSGGQSSLQQIQHSTMRANQAPALRSGAGGGQGAPAGGMAPWSGGRGVAASSGTGSAMTRGFGVAAFGAGLALEAGRTAVGTVRAAKDTVASGVATGGGALGDSEATQLPRTGPLGYLPQSATGPRHAGGGQGTGTVPPATRTPGQPAQAPTAPGAGVTPAAPSQGGAVQRPTMPPPPAPTPRRN